MDIKYYLRRMNTLRNICYFFHQKSEIGKIPKNEYDSSLERIRSMKGAYNGKRCFIIGNGPSLKATDLDKLKNEYTFAANRIFTIYGKTEWRPTFFCVQDYDVLKNMLDDIKATIGQSKYGFVSTKHYMVCKNTVSGLSNLNWMPMRMIPPKKNTYQFSDDVTKQVVEGLTITYSCMQLAAYMGFSEIYLLGVDHNYSIEIDSDGNIIKNDESVKNYFDEAKVSINDINLPKVVEMTRAYLSAERYSRDHGFRIFNATRGGKLEMFERVNFDVIVE